MSSNFCGCKGTTFPTLSPTLSQGIKDFHPCMTESQTNCQSKRKKNFWHGICFYIDVQTEAQTEKLGPADAHEHLFIN